jgi:hypothetical protein
VARSRREAGNHDAQAFPRGTLHAQRRRIVASSRLRTLRALSLATLVTCALACGGRTSPVLPATSCAEDAPACIVDGAYCEPARTSEARCDALTHRWTCPAPARIYERATEADTCLPFSATPGLSALGSWGLSSLARVPTDDGRCLWIADSAQLSDGTTARNVAFEADRRAPFGTCPSTSVMPPTPIVTMEGGDDPTLLVQIDHGYRLGGRTHVLYRVFRSDGSATFGVTELGGGVARWDAATQRIVVPDPRAPFPWGLDLDLGDAAIVADDGAHAYVWGCRDGASPLLESCRLARLDAADAVELLGFGGSFIRSTRAAEAPAVFDSGPWTSSVVAVPGGYRHVYVGAFGRELVSQVASSPLGPWRAGDGLGGCVLPADDDKASCAGPIVHLELADPTRPGELPIAYGIGRTGTPTGRREDYWARLVWAR